MWLREIYRTAAFAWSPGSGLPLIVTGTRAGAVDADFSDEVKLELWDLSLESEDSFLELQPKISISTDSRFHDIAWAPASDEHPLGIIAGALENGSLGLWDAAKLLHGESDAFMSRTTKHTGEIKSLQFNPLRPQILATVGTKGELYVYDVNDISNPFRLGSAAARADDLECVAWNRKVPHILATGGTGGFVTVWDLKTRKASLSLNNNRKAVSAIEWDPNNPTKLLTATPDNSAPIILLWDLRNSNAPEKTLQGHDKGILSLSWCQQDSSLLLSCGEDQRTLCWNPQTGELLGEFPSVSNWTFQTRFNPHNPNFQATASFEGKISVRALQSTNPSASQVTAQGQADDEDFFSKAQSQPQGKAFSLPRAPNWLEKPVGASFGFGGKLVSFNLHQTSSGAPRSSVVKISRYSVDSDVGAASEKFEATLLSGNLGSICESHISAADSESEQADWKVIQALITAAPREGVIEYLGLSDKESALNGDAHVEPSSTSGETKDLTKETELSQNGEADAKKKSRLSTFFADGGDGDDFLSNIAATKDAKTDSPFELFSDKDSALDRKITKALILGQFEIAMNLCLAENKLADALMIANCGGQDLMEKAQAAYLSRKVGGPNYLRLLSSVIGKNLWDVVYNADLRSWKETMATVCTYADSNEFSDLCEALGDRILESGKRQDASFCYLVGSKLEKVVGIWISELGENEQARLGESGSDSTFTVHAHFLQNFVEKVTVFRTVTKFQDEEKSLSTGWKLVPLYDKYIEYADIVSAYGHLETAGKYLELVPLQYPAAEIARNRIKLASGKFAQQTSARQPQNTGSRNQPRSQPLSSYLPQQAAASARPAAASDRYAPPTSSMPANYLGSSQPQNPYAPQPNFLEPQQQPGYSNPMIPAPLGYPQAGQFNNLDGPPRNLSPAVPPPSKAKEMVNWNDTPMVTKPAISRRGTPGVHPQQAPSPYAPQQNYAQQNLVQPPPMSAYGGPRSTPTPPPPPPKGPAPPRMSSPPTNMGPPSSSSQPPQRSSSTSMYTPLASQSGPPLSRETMTTIPARVSSPYNLPPSGAPPANRYTPSTISQQYAESNVPQPQIAAPPMGGSRPPAVNPYAPQQSAPGQYNPAQLSYQPSQGDNRFTEQQNARPPSQGPPPPGPPPSTSRPNTAQSQVSKTAAINPTRYPPGDRSHIPVNAQQLVSILSADMQRVASQAPQSFANQVKDTEKRLNILFDHLNNEDLMKEDTIGKLSELAQALKARDYEQAARLQVDIHREKAAECGSWMVGVKRLINMSKVTP